MRGIRWLSGPVILADGAVVPGSGHVEVAQGAELEAVGQVAPLEHLLHDELALAVGVGGVLRVGLVDGHILRLAEGGGGGGEHQIGHLVGEHGLDEGQPGSDVVAEILFGTCILSPTREKAAKWMTARWAPWKIHRPGRPGRLRCHIEAAALEGLPVALGQVVHHHHVGPPLDQAPRSGCRYTRAAGSLRIAIAKTSFLL